MKKLVVNPWMANEWVARLQAMKVETIPLKRPALAFSHSAGHRNEAGAKPSASLPPTRRVIDTVRRSAVIGIAVSTFLISALSGSAAVGPNYARPASAVPATYKS